MADASEFPELIRRVQTGDQAAATELVRRYEPEVRRFVRYRLADSCLRRFLDSLDICQSVFAKFFVQLQQGRLELSDPRQLYKLLYLMAGSKLQDHLRKRLAQRRAGSARETTDGLALATVADRTPGPVDLSAWRDLLAVFREYLPEPEQALLDQWLLGHDWTALAAGAGTSPEAVRKRLSRAIDRAAEELGLENFL